MSKLFLVGFAIGLLGEQGARAEELCTDTRDNDADGFVDCADSDCCSEPSCLALGCTRFERGDTDGDGRRTVTDAIAV